MGEKRRLDTQRVEPAKLQRADEELVSRSRLPSGIHQDDLFMGEDEVLDLVTSDAAADTDAVACWPPSSVLYDDPSQQALLQSAIQRLNEQLSPPRSQLPHSLPSKGGGDTGPVVRAPLLTAAAGGAVPSKAPVQLADFDNSCFRSMLAELSGIRPAAEHLDLNRTSTAGSSCESSPPLSSSDPMKEEAAALPDRARALSNEQRDRAQHAVSSTPARMSLPKPLENSDVSASAPTYPEMRPPVSAEYLDARDRLLEEYLSQYPPMTDFAAVEASAGALSGNPVLDAEDFAKFAMLASQLARHRASGDWRFPASGLIPILSNANLLPCLQPAFAPPTAASATPRVELSRPRVAATARPSACTHRQPPPAAVSRLPKVAPAAAPAPYCASTLNPQGPACVRTAAAPSASPMFSTLPPAMAQPGTTHMPTAGAVGVPLAPAVAPAHPSNTMAAPPAATAQPSSGSTGQGAAPKEGPIEPHLVLFHSALKEQRSPALAGLAQEAALAAAAAASAASVSAGRRLSASGADNTKHVAAAAAAAAASRLIHAEAEASSSARGSTRTACINRRAWSAEEDNTIRACVNKMGMRWRLIAPLLPGRSDDSVRNRWKRLQEEDSEVAGKDDAGDRVAALGEQEPSKATVAPAPPVEVLAKKSSASARRTSRSKDDDSQEGEGGQRVSWSPYEDQVIVNAVQELGPRWCFVAARLPSRTDQAVRNRWNRLQQRARVQARTMLSSFGDQAISPPVRIAS